MGCCVQLCWKQSERLVSYPIRDVTEISRHVITTPRMFWEVPAVKKSFENPYSQIDVLVPRPLPITCSNACFRPFSYYLVRNQSIVYRTFRPTPETFLRRMFASHTPAVYCGQTWAVFMAFSRIQSVVLSTVSFGENNDGCVNRWRQSKNGRSRINIYLQAIGHSFGDLQCNFSSFVFCMIPLRKDEQKIVIIVAPAPQCLMQGPISMNALR